MGAFSAVLLFGHEPVRGVPQLAGRIERQSIALMPPVPQASTMTPKGVG
jgi:hypothetical protein